MIEPSTRMARDVGSRSSPGAGGPLPELFLGMVRPQGADGLKKSLHHLEDKLRQHRFHPCRISISHLIEEQWAKVEANGNPHEYDSRVARKYLLMLWGDVLRNGVDPAVGAMMAVKEINQIREEVQEAARALNMQGVAYIVRNLMNEFEIELLRSTYQQRFFAVALHQDARTRRQNLLAVERSEGTGHSKAAQEVERLLLLDQGTLTTGGAPKSEALNTVHAMEKADVHVTVERHNTLNRFIRQLFGYPFGVPLPSEMGMAHAFLASKNSVALGRSVGAVISDGDGNVLGMGWNEVPHPRFGVARALRNISETELRDHAFGYDTSDKHRVDSLFEFVNLLSSLNLTGEDGSEVDSESQDGIHGQGGELPPEGDPLHIELIEIIASIQPALHRFRRDHVKYLFQYEQVASARLLNLIEFGRSVHAEMAAITDCSRRGTSTAGQHMLVTTFPCHECARNIVAAGIRTVTYLEPYEKSMSADLYSNGIAEFRTVPIDPAKWGQTSGGLPTIFAPFEGISPARFDDLFSTVQRKISIKDAALNAMHGKEGVSVNWPTADSELRDSILGYRQGRVRQGFEDGRLGAETSVIEDLNSLEESWLEKREIPGSKSQTDDRTE